MRELLKGLVDMHIHGSPSIAPRMETWEYLQEMDEAGYRAIGFKEHFLPTTGAAYLFQHCPRRLQTEVIGSLVLNNAVGGFNIMAVDAACRMGARMIFMPTVSAQNHCEYLKHVKKFGGGSLSIPEKPMTVLNEKGFLRQDVIAILDYLGQKANITLSMGHLSPPEIDVLLPAAFSRGIKKIVIDHPYFILNASTKQVEDWGKQGVFINFTCSSLQGNGKNGQVPLKILEKTLEIVPEDQMVISSDYGQPYNGSPVKGMERMLETLIKDLKIPEQQVIKMTHETPAYLLAV